MVRHILTIKISINQSVHSHPKQNARTTCATTRKMYCATLWLCFPVNGWWKCGDTTWPTHFWHFFFTCDCSKKLPSVHFPLSSSNPPFIISAVGLTYFYSLDCSFKTQKPSQDFKKRPQMCLAQLNKRSNECDAGIYMGWNRNTANKFRLF